VRFRLIKKAQIWWFRWGLNALLHDLQHLRREIEIEGNMILRWDDLFQHPDFGDEASMLAARAVRSVLALREMGEEAAVPWRHPIGTGYTVCWRAWSSEGRTVVSRCDSLKQAQIAAEIDCCEPLEWDTATKGHLWLSDLPAGRYSIWKGEQP
jgi:hypothetical protein